MEVAHELDERQECTAEFAQEKIFFPPDIHTLCNSSSFAWLEKNGGAALITPPTPKHTHNHTPISPWQELSLSACRHVDPSVADEANLPHCFSLFLALKLSHPVPAGSFIAGCQVSISPPSPPLPIAGQSLKMPPFRCLELWGLGVV